MEDRRVEEVKRRVRERVAAPVDDPAVQQRIAAVGDERVEIRGERPRQRDGEERVEREGTRVSRE